MDLYKETVKIKNKKNNLFDSTKKTFFLKTTNRTVSKLSTSVNMQKKN